MLNILELPGLLTFHSKSLAPNSFVLAVGVLPYPTFLCTDLSVNSMVRNVPMLGLIGLLLNVWVVFILWSGALPPQPVMDPPKLPPVGPMAGVEGLALERCLHDCLSRAQFCDVRLSHFGKRELAGTGLQ